MWKNVKMNQCPYCDFKSAVSTNVRYHIEAFHGGGSVHSYNCPFCGKQFKSKKFMLSHMSKYEGKCGNNASDDYAMGNDSIEMVLEQIYEEGGIGENLSKNDKIEMEDTECVNAKQPDEKKNIENKEILKIKNDFEDIDIDIENIYKDILNPDFTLTLGTECSLCKTVVPESNFQEHILQEHCTNKMLNCELCEFIFDTKDALRYHCVKVHKDISFPCDLCNKKFKDLDSHVKYFHDRKRDFKCNYCEKEFQANFILQNHVKSVHHGTKMNCPDCNKNLSIDNFLRHRKEKHEKIKRPCPHCEKEFGLSNLPRHIRGVHNNETTKCPECSKSIALFNMKTHINMIHKKIKQNCDICNELVGFYSLSVHKRRVHNVGKDINNVTPRGPNIKAKEKVSAQ